MNGRSVIPPGDLKAFWDELLREALARAGATCGSLCGPTAPYEVAVIDPTYHTAERVQRGPESRIVRAPSPSADEPELIAYEAVEDFHAGVVNRLEWPDAVPRGRGRPESARLVARAVARANGMTLLSISPGDFGGHLVRLRHSLSGTVPLPPVILLSILVEGDEPIVLPPLAQAPQTRQPVSDAAVADYFRERAERFFVETGRKPFRNHMFTECRNETGATYRQMERVWPRSMPAHLRRGLGERG